MPNPIPGIATAVYQSVLFCFALQTTIAGSAEAGEFRQILVDGELGDWAGAVAAHSDPQGDNGGAAVDVRDVYVANDDRFVYLRFDLQSLAGVQTLNSPLRILIDSDNDIATGYSVHGIGSDILVECSPGGGSGIDVWEQNAVDFYSVDLGHGSFETYFGPTVAATSFEVRLLRSTFLPSHNTIAFPSPEIRVVLDGLNGSSSAELVPNSGSLLYTLSAGTPDPLPDNDLARSTPEHVRFMSYNSRSGRMFGSGAAATTRLLQAIVPDVIGFQELWDYSAADVENRLDADLPISGGNWFAIKGNDGQITASRWPLAVDPTAPSLDLAVLIDLPDGTYSTDLLVINSHMKCCGGLGTFEDDLRQDQCDAVTAWVRGLQASGGSLLATNTPIVHLGDFNMVGGPQPLETLLTGDIVNEGTYGPDHDPDWDGSGWERSFPVHSDGLARYTWRNNVSSFAPGKLDFILYTGSVVTPGNGFVLNTADMSESKLNALGLLSGDSQSASDHMPLVQDLLPNGVLVAVSPGAPGTRLSLRASPNPTTGSALLSFTLPAPGRASLVVYDAVGRARYQIADESLGAGTHARELTPASGLEPGVYFVRLHLAPRSGSPRAATTKLVVTR